jgi:excisionase family DNA binding protein
VTTEVRDNEVLAPDEVARVLRLPIATVREGLRRGEIPGKRIMYRWRTRRSDLDALLTPRPTSTTSPTPATRPVPTVTSAPPLGQVGRPRKRRLRDRVPQ